MKQLLPFIKIISVALIGYLITRLICHFIYRYFNHKRRGQVEREYLESHKKKSGTATMGGIGFVTSTIVATAIIAPDFFTDSLNQAVIIVFASFFLIGLIDDLLKYLRQSHLGLPGMLRLFLEALSVLSALHVAGFANQSLWYYQVPMIDQIFALNIWFIVITLLLVIGFGNASNLTDGLDGLATGMIMMAITPFLFFALKDNFQLAVFLSALIGSLLGFLKYNFHPAKLFMGDCGSLALGGALAMVAVIGKHEAILIVAALFLLLEAFSVIMQVGCFRLTGKRLFKMAPFHHHLEKKGWPEWKVIMTCWIVGFLLATISTMMGVI